MNIQNLPTIKASEALNPNQVATKQAVKVSVTEIEDWMVFYIADLLEVDSSEINVKDPFDVFSLDSSMAIGLTGDLEDWLGCKLDPTLLYNYPTIQILAKHLSEKIAIK